MASRNHASEESPLLSPRQTNGISKAYGGGESDDDSSSTNSGSRSATFSIDEESTEAVAEPLARHASAASIDREAQFKGNPEMRKKMRYIFPAISLGVFLSAADQTIIVSSYGKIGSDLNALNLTSWIATSYFLTLTSFQPLYGKLSDIFGRKACLLYAYAVFGLGCLFCGLAQDINQLIAARVFQGIGGGGMTTVVSILLSDIIPLKERGMWQGLINIIYASGAGSGAPLGGIVADSIGWRWAFLAQAPICLVAFLCVLFILKLPPDEQHPPSSPSFPTPASENSNSDPTSSSSSWRAQLRRIDFLGASVLVLAVFGLVFGLDRGSNQSWTLPIAYIPLLSSFVLFCLFIFIETNVAREPFAPGHIILRRPMLSCYLCYFFSFSGYLALLYYISLYFQAAQVLSATGASLRLLPAIIAGVSGSLLGGYVMKRTGRYYWLTVLAYSLLAFGMLIVLLFSGLVLTNNWAIAAGLVAAGFGNGIGVTTALIALISNADPSDQAVTTACSYLFRSLGSVIGISLSSAVIQQRLKKNLERSLGSGDEAARIEKGVRQSLDYLKKLDPHVRQLVKKAYGDASTYGFALMLAILLGATVSSFFIREKKLSR